MHISEEDHTKSEEMGGLPHVDSKFMTQPTENGSFVSSLSVGTPSDVTAQHRVDISTRNGFPDGNGNEKFAGTESPLFSLSLTFEFLLRDNECRVVNGLFTLRMKACQLTNNVYFLW